MLDRVSAAWMEDRRLPKAIAGPDRAEFWIYLWDPLLTHFAS
jgi:hypothetical protein